MAGSLYLQGYDGLAFVLGWTGGYVLVAVLDGPLPAQVRRLYRAGFPRRPLRRQPRPVHRA